MQARLCVDKSEYNSYKSRAIFVTATGAMIISCPTCSTRYTLDDKAMGAKGRKVRCAKCGHVWWQPPVEGQAPAIPEAAVRAENREGRPAEPAPSKPVSGSRTGRVMPGQAGHAGRRALVGWGILALAVAGIVVGGIMAREAIVSAWPPAALFYETVGLPVEPPGAGLQFQNVRSEQRTENGATVIYVEGQILNASDRERSVPTLRVILRGPDAQPLRSVTLDAEPRRLLPGEIATFRHDEPAPGTVAEVTVTFDGG